jgi:gamma-glutamyl phosphate reductase
VLEIDLVTLDEPVLVLVEVTEPVVVRVFLKLSDPLDERVKDADEEVVLDGAIERVRVGDAVCVFEPRPDFVVDGLDELVLEFVVVAVVVFVLRGVEDPMEDPVLVLELVVV